MKYVRFVADRTEHTGTWEDHHVTASGKRWQLSEVRLLAPCSPGKIVCVGRNYADHVAEMGSTLPKEPLLFFKPPSAVLGPEGTIELPKQSARVEFEGELAVVVGRRCRNVPRESAGEVIWGYTLLNDVTARDLQRADGQWARAKGFDTFAPIGPCIASGLDAANLRLRTRRNGRLAQDSDTCNMVFDVPALIEYISAAFTLEEGDVIGTGTPSGVGPLEDGDSIEIDIEEIGVLRNSVVRARSTHQI
ncbi:MAG: fumarylacetoacetate hydrolase family protein [Candidatus Eremiobacteraeota bacterium]|nr:fumarylacetoacetate hydrolase family protein [Candidatus Eremiobacteraeota bacterium]